MCSSDLIKKIKFMLDFCLTIQYNNVRSRDKQLRSETRFDGILAQLGEHLPYKQRVTGSSPVGPIIKRNE